MGFIPLTKSDLTQKRWDSVDVALITGDAYVDHPSFAMAILGRVLEKKGYKAAIISMPDPKKPDSANEFGKPSLFFGVSSGNIDSMLARYTAFNKVRNDDPYAPGGKAGAKPERALIVYCNLVKRAHKDVPIVIGGIEASMRRFAHYDFWSNKVRRSIIQDCRADILVYGMGEYQIAEIADRLAAGKSLDGIPGTVILSDKIPDNAVLLPSEEDTINSKDAFLELYRLLYQYPHKILAQPAAKRFIVQYPQPDIDSAFLDSIYELPFERAPHPAYKDKIPAFDMICASVNSHRGCVSGCSFCSLSLHQGRKIVSRSAESVMNEIKDIAARKIFRHHITDTGGPSANMYGASCTKKWNCGRESCTYPTLCPNLDLQTKEWITLLDNAAQLKGVKQLTVGSGIRYDLFMADRDSTKLLGALCESHVSGQLKIAPEHISLNVLNAMRKTPLYGLKEFADTFTAVNKRLNKKQYLIPYVMTCHPGCGIAETIKMKEKIFSIFNFIPKQIQAFIPLPMTLSSVIYYTGIDPITGEKFFVERDKVKRKKQHDIFFKNFKNKIYKK